MTSNTTRPLVNNHILGEDLVPIGGTWKITTLILLQIAISLITLFLISTLVTMKRQRKSNSQTNDLILNQAFCDLCVALIFIPNVIIDHVSPSVSTKTALSHVICFILLLNVFSLQALALHRYCQVRDPLRKYRFDEQKTFFFTKNFNKVLFCVWFTPLFLTLLPFAWSSAPIDIRVQSFRIFLPIVWILLCIDFISLLSINILILYKVKKHLSNSSSRQSQTSFNFSAYRYDVATQAITSYGSKTSVGATTVQLPSSGQFSPITKVKVPTAINAAVRKQRRSGINSAKNLSCSTSNLLKVSLSLTGSSAAGNRERSFSSGDRRLADLETLLKAVPKVKSTSEASLGQVKSKQHLSPSTSSNPQGNRALRLGLKPWVNRAKKRSRFQNKQREMRMTRLLAALILNYFLCYFPVVVINVIYLFDLDIEIPPWFHVVSFYTFIANSFVNPILYVLMKKDIQVNFKIFCRQLMKKLTTLISATDTNL